MVGGGDHFDGAGGYSGGGAEASINIGGFNGLGSDTKTISGSASGGGGYFGRGNGMAANLKGTSAIGGQNGTPHFSDDWFKDLAGDGGQAGAGGEVYYFDINNIFAYNGDMITNGDYNNDYFEYNEDGTIISEKKLEVITKQNNQKIIPAKIFAQSGAIRETYTTNQGIFTLSKVKIEGELPAIAKSFAEVKLVKATNREEIPTTNYSNGYMINQGIGSRSSAI